MAKDQNHTNHNQGYKLHRNGIKKPKVRRHMDTRGMDPKFVRNLHHVRKGLMRVRRAAAEAAAKEAAAKKQ